MRFSVKSGGGNNVSARANNLLLTKTCVGLLVGSLIAGRLLGNNLFSIYVTGRIGFVTNLGLATALEVIRYGESRLFRSV